MKEMNNPITTKQAAYIRRNMNKVTFHNIRSALKVSSEVMYEWLKNVHRPDKLIVIDEDLKELHSTYLVTLNQFNYMVNFNVPIDYDTIQYCTDQIGYDYEVGKLANWEYDRLRNHIPCINIKTDAHYVANFWATTKLWKE
jgi:hypothetical protein